MNRIIQGDALTVLKTLPDQCVQTTVTSPPYFRLRDYGAQKQLGMEQTPEEYVERLVAIFREVRRVLRHDGTLWLNLGDTYGDGSSYTLNQSHEADVRCHELGYPMKVKERLRCTRKNLIGIPWRVAFALQADGWYLRQDIIWEKPNVTPESVRDRCTRAHEYIFLLSRSQKYYFDADAIKEKAIYGDDPRVLLGRVQCHGKRRGKKGTGQAGFTCLKEKRNKRSVWTVATKPYNGAHFAAYPPDLIRPCILAGAPPQYTVLDPFMGSGTTAFVARELHRHYLGIELNPEYINLARERLGETPLKAVA